MIPFKKTLQASYMDNAHAEQKLKNDGYILDKEISNRESKAYFNPEENKLLITYRGTSNLKDVGTDLALLTGNIKNTQRYKESKKFSNIAKTKYNVNDATFIGHSLGGSLSSSVADKNDKVFTFNKGYTILGKSTRTRGNEKAFRQEGDIVSLLDTNAKTQKNHGFFSRIIPKYSLLGILKSHSTSNIKNNHFVN